MSGNIVFHEAAQRATAASSWSWDFNNPALGDLILITVHCTDATVSAITYGGVTPEFMESAATSWPQTYLYGIRAVNQPATGQSHTLSVTLSGSSTGGVSVTKIEGVDSSVLSTTLDNVFTGAQDDDTVNAGLGQNLTVPWAETIMFGVLTHEAGCPPSPWLPDYEDTIHLTAACTESPRGMGVAYRFLPQSVSAGIGWLFGTGRRRFVFAAFPAAYISPLSTSNHITTDITNSSARLNWDGPIQ